VFYPLTVPLVVPTVDADELPGAFQRGQSHGGGDFAHLAVGPEMNHPVVPGETEVLHQPDSGRQIVIVRDYRAPLKRVQELRGMEAEDLGVAEVADHQPLVCAAE